MSRILLLVIVGVVVCSSALFFLDDFRTSRMGDIIPPSLPEDACSSDVDCATGGCSGEVCGLSEDVEGIITTCIYLDSYQCLELTECGCVDGACMWKENEDYLACMSPYMD